MRTAKEERKIPLFTKYSKALISILGVTVFFIVLAFIVLDVYFTAMHKEAPTGIVDCDFSKNSILFTDTTITVDKKEHFCGRDIPEKTRIFLPKKDSILPVEEDKDRAVFNVNFRDLPKDWHIVANR